MTLDPSETFGRDSFETFLVNTINDLDFSDFWVHEDCGGEAPYDPRAMLGLILYGFCRGIFSSRKLEHACRHDLGFMYVSGHNSPDHAAICRFLKRYAKELKPLFRQVVYVAHSKGFIDYHCLALDGTKIRAHVSRNYTGTLADFKKRIGAIDLYIEKAMERMEDRTGAEAQSCQAKIDKARKEQERIKDFLKTATEQQTVAGTEKKQNIIESECRVMVLSDGTCKEAYNAQACVDEKNGLVVGQVVVQAENDMKQLNPVLKEVVYVTTEHTSPTKVLADAGYWDPEQIAQAEAQGYETYVPDPTALHPHKDENQEHAKATLVSVEVQGEQVVARCSGGKPIPATAGIRKHKNRDKGDAFRLFPTQKTGECLTCPYQTRCFPEGRKVKEFAMSVAKVTHHGTTTKVTQRMTSEAGRKIFSRRMPLIERTFAEIKTTMGFRRFLRRGLVAANLEWTLLCMAFNLRRMHAVMQRT